MRTAIVLSTYRPNLAYLKAQLESLVSQTVRDFVCIVVEDSGDREIAGQVESLLAECFKPSTSLSGIGGPQYDFRVNFGNLGVWHSFEAGLTRALKAYPDVDFFFLCDQDDVWHPEKLEKLIQRFDSDSRVMAVHSDLRLVDASGKEIAASCWQAEKRDLQVRTSQDLLFRNSITGCAAGFRRKGVELALPFAPQQRIPDYYHDLWLGLCALSVGKIVPVFECLVDYRQHSGNVLGAEIGRGAEMGLRPPDRGPQVPKRDYWKSQWLIRQRARADFQGRLPGSKLGWGFSWRRLMQPKLALGLLFGELMFRAETARSKLKIFRFLIWKSKSLLQFGWKKFRVKFSFFPPPLNASQFLDKKSEIPLNLIRDPSSRGRRLHILLPSLRPKDVYGGASTALSLGASFLKRGLPLNLYSTEQTLTALHEKESREKELRNILFKINPVYQSHAHLVTILDLNDRTREVRAIGPEDWFLVSAWWSAIQAQRVIQRLDLKTKRFLYLIQDFEPNFYPWSKDFAGALSSYLLDFVPIFNSPSLAAFFTKNEVISTASQEWSAPGQIKSLTLAPVVPFSVYFPPCIEKMSSQKHLRILVYGRPRVARNLFELLIVGLDRWIQQSRLGRGRVEIFSAGESHAPIHLSNGILCQSLGKIPLGQYPAVLRGFDIGISLMLSPHPSYPPLEMAASGMLVVTNRFAGKDLSTISSNFISCEPTVAGIVEALVLASSRRSQYAERIRASVFEFPEASELESVVDTAIAKLDATSSAQSERPLPHLLKTSPDTPRFQSH